jgi:nitrogen fixation protein
MNKLNSMIAIAALAITFTACKKDSEEPIIVVPPSDGATLTLNGKTAESNYTNIVYADLSTDKSVAVDRKSWALGFYSGADFKVVINQSFQGLAQAINKTDINAVTLDDAKASMVYNISLLSSTLTNAVSLVDYYDGSLNRTAIATVSANESDNKVYILGLNGSYTEPNLYKVRILRNGTAGYILQYAKVQETTFKTVNISKNTDYNLSFVSLGNNNDGKIVNVEPKKVEWDLHWSYSTYKSVATAPESNPYFYQDFITINSLAGVSAAEIITTSTLTYTSFSEANLSAATFLNTRDAIGSNWRVTTGTGIKTDRFYAVKDSAGNIYKLRFVSMGVGNDGGERGKPVIEYKLVKKG